MSGQYFKNEKEYYQTVVEVIKSRNSTRESVWDNAEKLYEIVRSEQYKKHYDTMTEFSKGLGISKSLLSQYCQAVKFQKRVGLKKTEFDLSSTYLLSTLGDGYESYLEDLKNNGLTLDNLSTAALRQSIKEFKEGGICQGEGIASFSLNGVRYRIPYSVLNKYKINTVKK